MGGFANGVGKSNGMVRFVLGGGDAACGLVDEEFSLLGGDAFFGAGEGGCFCECKEEVGAPEKGADDDEGGEGG